MGRMQEYLTMKTDLVAKELISSDINQLKLEAMKLIDNATKLGGLGFETSFLKWVASFSAISALVERMPVLDEATFSGRRAGSLPTSVSTSTGTARNLPNGIAKSAAAPIADLLDLSSDDAPEV